MSNTSGTSEQVISLPKGGGALHGIGEKFSPDLFTGTGNFTVPIALPPGRNGFQPQLNLVYSTGNGNGPFGLGWSLSIPGVSRKISKGVPIYDDTKDTFLLSGAEDLVLVEVEKTESSTEKQTRSRYHPRTEGLFAKIDHYQVVDKASGMILSNYWEVRSKDGLVSVYGTPGTAGNDPAVVAKPADRSRIFAWKLTSTTDPFGNRIVYEYLRDSEQIGPHDWDQLYLKRIQYADYSDESGAEHFLVSVTFDYDPAEGGSPDTLERPDAFSDYRAGFEIRTRRRCEQIVIETHAEVDQIVRTYDLSYQNDALNGVSLLNRIEVIGHDGDRTEKLPPLAFGYTQFEPEKRHFSPITGPDMPAGSLARGDQELASLFGNGLPDILQMNGTVRYWRNMGGGKFNLPREMRTAPAGLGLADRGVQLIDANGDGQIDLLVTTEEIAGYYPQRFGGLWDRRSFQRYRVAPSFDLKDPEVKMVDLDGDGVTDAIRSGTRLECFFNDAHEGWTKTRWIERRALEVFPNVNFSDPRVKWGDMTGDGLQDIALVYNGIVQYWPSLGRGDWGKRITMQNSPHFPYNYDPKRILVGDVDGDGLADIVYVDDTKVTLWINQSGNRWSDPIVIEGTPPVSDMDAVRLDDMLGSGIRGILWSSDANGLSRANMFFLDFTGGTKPYVLNEMDNHMGAITRVGYAPSTHFYLEDDKCLATRWKTTLPFPVQVVARVEVIDAISGGKLTTEYSYHHGYWDGAEREFRGFGRVDHRDSEVFEDFHAPGLHPADKLFNAVSTEFFSPPTETHTWFHQGPIGDEFGDWTETDFTGEFWPDDTQVLSRPPSVVNFLKSLPRRVKRDALRAMRGRILRTELYALDGTERQDSPYTVTEHLHSVREESPPGPGEAPDRLHIFFPHTLAERTTQWERGGDPMHQFKFTSDYDEYGQLLSQSNIAVPRGRDFRVTGMPGEPYLVTDTLTSYAKRDDAQHYIVDRVARTTTYEILNDGSPALFDLQAAIEAGTAIHRISAQTLNFYDGSLTQPLHGAFVGLPFRQIGDYGALVRSESLVLTTEILQEAYKSGNVVTTHPEEPPYLVPGGPPIWTTEYPQEFRDLLPPLAGYTYQPGGTSSEYETGYVAATERRRYDFHDDPGRKGRGLIKIKRDPLGHDTAIAYDVYNLLPVEVTDPADLTTKASYDYRVLQPMEVTEPNGNLTVDAFSPLGLLESTALIGKNGEGDTPSAPSTRFEYNFLDFIDKGQPIFVRTIRRVHHINDSAIPLPERDETIETVEYSDGFGRLLQTRMQAEDVIFGDPNFGDAGLPADQSLPVGDAGGQQLVAEEQPNVVVSGWQIYDNKGRVVEKYEPFFSKGWDYAHPTDVQFGQKVTMYYDPRGQLIRMVNPDGSEQLVIYGIPADLTMPEQFTPTPWEVYTYDANDNAGRTHPTISAGYQNHWNTPSNVVVDALGRSVQTVERNGANSTTDWYITRSTYDIRGNLLMVTDALNRLAFQHVYDLANRALRIEQLDVGVRRTIVDAAGNILEQRDSKGALILHTYDVLHRPIRFWARNDDRSPVSLRERLGYGDGSDPNQPGTERAANQAANRLGKLYKHYDEAGLLTFEIYDFKGNILEQVRQVISDATILAVFTPSPPNWQVSAFRVDWQPPDGTTLDDLANGLLDAMQYQVSPTYDALNRVQMTLYPQDVSGTRKALLPRYNRAGALENIKLDGTVYVEHIAYNAKGQRLLTAFGNGIMTRYTYDPKTFRLLRMRTEQYTHPAAFSYHPAGEALQDFAYMYDLIGNMIALHDRTPESGISTPPLGTDALDRAFTYDPIYRLLSATGRECDVPPLLPWDDTPRCTDITRTRGYTELYQYDPVGNMKRLQHQANGGFTRLFALAPQSNRLATMTVGTTVYDYAYDSNGNLVQETTSRHFEWDHSDRMQVFRTQTGDAEPSIHTHYLYDSSGQRVKKLVRNQGGQFEVTIYIDGVFEYHRLARGSTTQENNTLHVMDHEKRIALVRVGNPFPDDKTPTAKYHLGDHLGSSNIVVDDLGGLVNREEYTPYGETSFGSFTRKRYRFTGKERDEESGLCYFGARYYEPSLARWFSCDPAGLAVDPIQDEQAHANSPKTSPGRQNAVNFVKGNPHQYVQPVGLGLYTFNLNNPIRYRDQNGRFPKEIGRRDPDTLATHRGITAIALVGKVSPQALKDITRGNLHVDRVLNQRAGTVPTAEHGMMGPHGFPDISVRMNETIINQKIGKAAEAILNGNVKEARKLFGEATHTAQDKWAKAHRDASGKPLIWRWWDLKGVVQHIRTDKSERLHTDNVEQAVKETRNLFDQLYNLVHEKGENGAAIGSQQKAKLSMEEIDKRWHEFTSK